MEPDRLLCLDQDFRFNAAGYECNDDQTERPIHSNWLIDCETMNEVQVNVMEPQ